LKRYRDYNTYLREIFGERVQKISLDAGLSCPNRDGTISAKGCIFCDRRGSGTGAWINHRLSVREQVLRGRRSLQRRYGAKKFIAYFQSFTNTYAPLPRLKALYDEALDHDNVVGLSVATRPDCVDRSILELLSAYQRHYIVCIEFGLQSAHDKTLNRINRGHDVSCFEQSVHLANACGLNICVHVILGLPGENRQMMLQTARFISGLPIQAIKIHLLYVIKGTPLADLYEKGDFRCLEREEYVDLVVDFLEALSSDIVIQRLTGDPVKSELLAPAWTLEKSKNIRLIQENLERRNTWQGRLCRRSTAGTCR
jgi:radical SAM protein (TIGR01212 family)